MYINVDCKVTKPRLSIPYNLTAKSVNNVIDNKNFDYKVASGYRHLYLVFAAYTPIPLDGASATIRNFGKNDANRSRNGKGVVEAHISA